MRYSREHKAAARSRLLARGARHAKKHGFRASGMDALAAAAGVTTGAIYKHFAGKADLFAALIKAELDRTVDRFAAIPSHDSAQIRKTLAEYLSLQHVRKPESGCVLPCLTAEVAVADGAVRGACQEGLLGVHAIASRWTGSDDKAWALLAGQVGAVMLARAMRDEEVQQRILAATAREGEALLAWTGVGGESTSAPQRRPNRRRRG